MQRDGAGSATRRAEAQDTGGATQGPIFVVGPQRSGTTLLRLLLDSHPDVAIGPETGLMLRLEPLHEPYGTSGDDPWYAGIGWDRREVERSLGQLLDAMFTRFAATHGARRWGEKTPLHRYHMPELARMFPQARFVAVIRHPGAVAVSRGRWGYGDLETVRDWLLTMRHLLGARDEVGAARIHVLRYERLVADPEAVLARACDFLDLDVHPDMLHHHTVQARHGGPSRTDGGTLVTEPIDATRIDAWTRERTAEEIGRIGRWTGPALEALGYRVGSAALGAQWDAAAEQAALAGLRGCLEPLIAALPQEPDAGAAGP